MSTITSPYAVLSDANLLAEISRLATSERQATAQLVASLAELDSRRLFLGQGFSSTFTFCTQALHLSEQAAYNRIEAARAGRRFPVILDRLADGSITLTTIRLLSPHLTPENHDELVNAARHMSKRDVEELIARLRPLPPAPAIVRKLPTVKTGTPPSALPVAAPSSNDGQAAEPPLPQVSSPPPLAPALEPERAQRRSVVQPLSPEQYRIQVTVGRGTVEMLRRAQDLLRHAIPSGDPAAIVDRALAILIETLERKKLAMTTRPRKGGELVPGSRHIAAEVRRAVWARDEGRCAFVSPNGRRCQEHGFLEFHHTPPYAAGGAATIETIELRCRSHNLYEAELDFGPSIRQRQRVRGSTVASQ